MKAMFIPLAVFCVMAGEVSGQLTDAAAPANVPNDPPAAGYPGNPEVMKRYFPQMYRVDPSGNPVVVAPTPAAPRTFSLEFPGGTASELVQHLRHTLGENPNVMISPKLKDVDIPEFKLQNVTLGDVFQALNGLAGESMGGTWQLSGSREPIWVLNPTPQFGGGIDPLTGQPTGRQAQVHREVRVFPIGQFLGEYAVEDVTTSIQTAWGMMGDDSGGQIKFHKDTNLLIAVGSAQQLKLLQEVLAALSEEVAWKKQAKAEKSAGIEPGGKAR